MAQGGPKVARPTITVAGQDQSSLAEGLLSLVVAESTQGLFRCEATFGNWGGSGGGVGFLYFDRKLFDFGKAFAVKLGPDTVFDGRIMGIEAQFPEGGSPELTVLAEDRFQDLRMTRRTRTFADMSDGDVARQIAGDHQLSPAVDVSGPTHKVLAQVNQSDLAFLRDRARAIDAELWVQGDQLNLKTHARRNGGTFEMSYKRELREFSVLSDLATQRTSVTVSGWDVSAKDAIRHEATASTLGSELGSDESGASLLDKLGRRKESLAHTVPFTSEEAQAHAEAAFKTIARRFVTGRGVAEADKRLRVGSFVDLKGLGPLYSGKYYLSEVRLHFDGARGIRNEFVAERPGLGQAQ
jgi:phage protein D